MLPERLPLLLIRTMPFGKYKGRVIADLPGHYLNWFARAGFPPGELGQLLALMHELDHNQWAGNGLASPLDPLRVDGACAHPLRAGGSIMAFPEQPDAAAPRDKSEGVHHGFR